MVLSRDQILAADDIETREEPVPEWGGSVLLRALSGKERANYLASITQIRGRETLPNLANLQAKLVARAIVDEAGNRVFSDADINALGEKSGAALERLFQAASEMSGLSDEAITDAMGKSEATPSDASTSGSPGISAAPSLNSSPASPVPS